MTTADRRRPFALLVALVLALAACSSSAPSDQALPRFSPGSALPMASPLVYDPTGEHIFPSLFHAALYLDHPLGAWYLYDAPHENPGGISLLYADSLAGPWTEYAADPLIANDWPPNYSAADVPHVSSPDAVWNAQEKQVFLYFHGDNGTTRYATSPDGVTFRYGGVAVDDADGGPGTTESSYARVTPSPEPTADSRYLMLYMDNSEAGPRRIRVADSPDGRDWVVRPDPLIVGGAIEGTDVSGADLLTWGRSFYVVYHASSGSIFARRTDATLSEVGPPEVLYTPSTTAPDLGRAASPQVVTQDGRTYLFYEAGPRLSATIAVAEAAG